MKPYRVIKLMKNHIYPTFQLYAQMRQTRTDPKAGLKLAALVTLDWLRRRLDDDIPEELQHIPDPDEYLNCEDEQLRSFHINAGYLIDIVSMPAKGIWTLQIGEPDLGSDPGDPDQKRRPVPGRVIETNIAYKVEGGRLECGFQTLISDPDGTEGEAEVYRLAVVRQLAAHPDFGLRQLEPLTEDYEVLRTEEGLKRALALAKGKENQLPLVFFTQLQEEKQAAPKLPEMSTDILFQADFKLDLPSVPMPSQKQTVSDPPYDMAGFARYGVGLCRSYLVSADLLDKLSRQTKQKIRAGEILILEPVCFGGAASVLPYSPNKGRQQETMDKLRRLMYQYPRNREAHFGQLTFLSAARDRLLKQTQSVEEAADASAERWEEEKRQLELDYRDKLLERDQKLEELQKQLRRQQDYQERIEGEKRDLRRQMADTKQLCELLLAEKDEEIGYLKRKLGQPKTHEEIAPWVERNFQDRLILHSKAVALLEDRDARSIDVGLICDALDFLATDYWERRYQQITTEEMNSRCGEKYGRPFDVTPTGTTTIEFTPAQYKIKYFPGRAGKPVESPLDFHLGVGNDPENLLRIYFLHDDTKKLIVVGSLPRHLRAVTIK